MNSILVYGGPLRENKNQTIYIGGLLGETNSNSIKNIQIKFKNFIKKVLLYTLDNTTKIFYGLLKEPELNMLDENDELADGEEGEKPKVK